MNLLLDIGNSRVKWALADTDQWLAEGAEPLVEQQAEWPLLEALEVVPLRVLAVNVAGAAVTDALQEQLRSRWQLPAELAATAAETGGLRNGYRDPQQLGADRWLAMLAARRAVTGAVCVVDAGTALTVDLIEADGRHLGGFILPGSELMRASLERSTGDIRQRAAIAAAAADLHGPGRDTVSAIEAATLQASLGLIDRARNMTSTPASVVLSGGAAPALLAGLPADTRHRPRLVLEDLLLALGGQAEIAGA
jgi:type III pantothenate kinase